MNRPVLIAAGGTGGHVVPALAVAEVLQQRDVPVIWAGTSEGLEARMVPAAGIRMCRISIAGLRGKSRLQHLLAPLRLLRACLQSLGLMLRLKPRAVLGMGGFVSGPVGIAALLLRKPLVLHEQNAVAGMTNRWLSRPARRVFAAWSGAFPAERAVSVVGNPVRADIAALAETPLTQAFDEPGSALKVLVVGGSRGARALNQVVPSALGLLRTDVQVRHQCGAAEADAVRDAYRIACTGNQRLVADTTDFIDDMAAAYREAHLVICRAGAMTITELGAMGMPSILVPFPFAVDDHQTRNAEQLSRAGAAILMPQSELTAGALSSVLAELAADRARLHQMQVAARACFIPRAAEAVADALLEVAA